MLQLSKHVPILGKNCCSYACSLEEFLAKADAVLILDFCSAAIARMCAWYTKILFILRQSAFRPRDYRRHAGPFGKLGGEFPVDFPHGETELCQAGSGE